MSVPYFPTQSIVSEIATVNGIQKNALRAANCRGKMRVGLGRILVQTGVLNPGWNEVGFGKTIENPGGPLRNKNPES